jgi:hypothetical protein
MADRSQDRAPGLPSRVIPTFRPIQSSAITLQPKPGAAKRAEAFSQHGGFTEPP